MKYCCKKFTRYARDKAIHWDEEKKEYFSMINEWGYDVIVYNYCPFCGKCLDIMPSKDIL